MRAALREATAVSFPAEWVAKSLLSGAHEDLFLRAYVDGLDSLTLAERRGHLPGVTGAVAEAIAARVLEQEGLSLIAQLTGFGAHGVDLLLLTPAGNVLALEVKGTLRRGALPRLRRGRLDQMSVEWLDSANATMAEWDLEAADIFAGVIVVDLAANAVRLAASSDYRNYSPVNEIATLDHLFGAPPEHSPRTP
jgi:hypothetical protein